MQVHCVCTWKSCKKQKVPGGGRGGGWEAGSTPLQEAQGDVPREGVGGAGTPLQEANGDVPLDGVTFSSLE